MHKTDGVGRIFAWNYLFDSFSLLPRSRCRVSRVLCTSARAPVARQLDLGRVNCRSAWHGKIGAGKYVCDLEST
jgi:hypothetical protein